MECYKCKALLASLSSISIYGGPYYFFACINQKVTAQNKLALYLSKMKQGMESFRWKTVAETPKDTGKLAPVRFLQCGELSTLEGQERCR